MHTNRFIEEHPGVKENVLLEDSEARVTRISEHVKATELDLTSMRQFLYDEDGYSISTNRQRTHESIIATSFSKSCTLTKAMLMSGWVDRQRPNIISSVNRIQKTSRNIKSTLGRLCDIPSAADGCTRYVQSELEMPSCGNTWIMLAFHVNLSKLIRYSKQSWFSDFCT